MDTGMELKILAEINYEPCDQFCPVEGVECGIPTAKEVEGALVNNKIAWKCHSFNRLCFSTIYAAKKNNIEIDESYNFIGEPEEFFQQRESSSN